MNTLLDLNIPNKKKSKDNCVVDLHPAEFLDEHETESFFKIVD